MRTLIYQDGQYIGGDEARLSPLSPAFQCGFTLFETLRVDAQGRAFRLEAHLARLARSAAAFGLAPVPAAEEVRRAAARLCRENGVEDGRLRITLARREEGSPASTVVTVAPYEAPPEDEYEAGRDGRIAPYRVFRGSPAAGHKTGNLLEARLFHDGLPRGAEGIVLNDAGRVCEACFANVFAVFEGVLLTPPLAEGCLPGITRAAVLEIAGDSGLPVREEPFGPDRLSAASEAFLTNSLLGVMPLTRFEGKPIGTGRPGPRARKVREAYRTLLERDLR